MEDEFEYLVGKCFNKATGAVAAAAPDPLATNRSYLGFIFPSGRCKRTVRGWPSTKQRIAQASVGRRGERGKCFVLDVIVMIPSRARRQEKLPAPDVHLLCRVALAASAAAD